MEETKQSYRSIAREHGTNHVTLKKIAVEEGWNISHRVSKISKPAAPVHNKILGKTALRKIDELKEELGNNYSNVDEPLIVMYAKNYERYIELEQEINTEGILSFSIKNGTEYLSPRFTALLAIQKNLVTIANQLGLSIASRKKLGLKFERPGQEQKSIFDFANELSNIDEDLDDI